MMQEVVDDVLPRAIGSWRFGTLQKPDALPNVLADPDKIKEILSTSSANFYNFTPKDGNYHYGFSQKGDFVETYVTDTGAGIALKIKENFSKVGLLEGHILRIKRVRIWVLVWDCIFVELLLELHHGEIKADPKAAAKDQHFHSRLKVFKDKTRKS